jgi:hypothetical protein
VGLKKLGQENWSPVGFLTDWAKKFGVLWVFKKLGQENWSPVGFLRDWVKKFGVPWVF